MNRKLMLVEDDNVIRENYTELLSDEGFQVKACAERGEALDRCREELPDLVLLDIRLNEEREGGYVLCSDLRRLYPRLPIVFLSSHDSEADRISGFRFGADDYLNKDISTAHLVVRIESILRRTQIMLSSRQSANEDGPESFTRVGVTIDRQTNRVFWQGRPVDLTLSQFHIVCCMALSPGQVKTHGQLMRAADLYVESNTIVAHVKTIRERFRRIASDFNCIRTERGRGYRWVDA
jgi:two-component system OmpR family response regulator